MKKIIICPYCNEEYIEKFEKLLKEKGIKLKIECIGECGKMIPMCLLDGQILEADTVLDLIVKLDLEVKS